MPPPSCSYVLLLDVSHVSHRLICHRTAVTANDIPELPNIHIERTGCLSDREEITADINVPVRVCVV